MSDQIIIILHIIDCTVVNCLPIEFELYYWENAQYAHPCKVLVNIDFYFHLLIFVCPKPFKFTYMKMKIFENTFPSKFLVCFSLPRL